MESTLAPHKNYETNRVETGLLQICDGTQLIIDETSLDQGTLKDKGMSNVQSLNTLIHIQTVSYDFKYYQLDFPCDAPTLCLSKGKSIFNDYFDCHLKMKPSDIILQKVDDLNIIRNYITNIKYSNIQYSLDNIKEFVEKDFVEERKMNQKMTPEIFYNWLTIARLLTLSMGETNLSVDIWKKMREMEFERMERLNKN
jgi:hypothetical protein